MDHNQRATTWYRPYTASGPIYRETIKNITAIQISVSNTSDLFKHLGSDERGIAGELLVFKELVQSLEVLLTSRLKPRMHLPGKDMMAVAKEINASLSDIKKMSERLKDSYMERSVRTNFARIGGIFKRREFTKAEIREYTNRLKKSNDKIKNLLTSLNKYVSQIPQRCEISAHDTIHVDIWTPNKSRRLSKPKKNLQPAIQIQQMVLVPKNQRRNLKNYLDVDSESTFTITSFLSLYAVANFGHQFRAAILLYRYYSLNSMLDTTLVRDQVQ